jgi:protein-L-isoaspartate(D-aspartate) O-methyltransferase
MTAPNTTDIFSDDFAARAELLRRLQEETQVLKSENVIKAFQVVDRRQFVPEDYQIESYEDYPLPLPGGQTISQPTTVAFMLELLAVEFGQNVLDVGAGSGYTTALLAELVGDEGHVLGVEVIPELVAFAKERLSEYPQVDIALSHVGATDYPGAPFDRILVSAAATDVPEWLINQLLPGGIMVLPIGEALTKVTKHTADDEEKEDGLDYNLEEFPGFSFVPLQEE